MPQLINIKRSEIEEEHEGCVYCGIPGSFDETTTGCCGEAEFAKIILTSDCIFQESEVVIEEDCD